MANDTEMITTKTVVDLDEKTTPMDMDLFVIGNAGTATLKKLKWSSMLAAIKTKIAEWTFQTLNTSDKTIPGALNELNNKITFENHPEFFAFHDSCCLATNDAPAKIGYKGSEVWFDLYFKALNDTLEIGSIDENVLPNGALAIITCSGQSGKSYPLIVHAGLRKIYCDVIIPAGIYGINARWERAPR